LIGGSNLLTHQLFNPDLGVSAFVSAAHFSPPRAPLYLMDKAAPMLTNPQAFEGKLREIAVDLNIPPEWIMAVIYAESRFDPAVVNRRGSSATGLIQFMPATAAELGVTVQRLALLTPTQQLDYVQRYLKQVHQRYGPYRSLTDLYLGILYPKARQQDYCYTLYAKPSQAYERNTGLDEDRDGRVSSSDVDRYLRRMFPTAYALSLDSEGQPAQ
jgi:soluble lytic murein transglycosylase-like protein